MGLEGAITLSLETSHFSDRLDVLARTFWAYYCQHGPSRRGSLRSRAFSSYRKTGTQANRPSSHQSKGPMPCRIDPCPLKPPVISTAQHGLRLFISTVGRRGGANRHRVILRGSPPLQFYIRALDAQDFSFDRLSIWSTIRWIPFIASAGQPVSRAGLALS